MTPPPAPDPITTKSTSVEGVNCLIVVSPVLSLFAGFEGRGVVVAERRLEIQRVLKPDELPPCFVEIAAVLRARKHPGERVFANREEERRFLDGREQLNLLGGRQRR